MNDYRRFNDIDVICEMKNSGEVVPLRLQIRSEDGMLQQYNIHNYRIVRGKIGQIMPDGVPVTSSTSVFECTIPVFGTNKIVYLYFNPSQEKKWWVTATLK